MGEHNWGIIVVGVCGTKGAKLDRATATHMDGLNRPKQGMIITDHDILYIYTLIEYPYIHIYIQCIYICTRVYIYVYIYIPVDPLT